MAKAEQGGAGAGRPKGSHLLSNLIIAALALLASLLYLLPSDPALLGRVVDLQRPFKRAEQLRQLAAMMRGDPRPGDRVVPDTRSPLGVALARMGAGKQPAMVLVIGTCTTCAAEGLAQWQTIAAQRPGRSIIVLSRSTPAGVAEFVRSHRFPLAIFSDPVGRASGRFNPLWAPRAYAVNCDGRLVWVQKDPEAAPDALASRLWDGKRS